MSGRKGTIEQFTERSIPKIHLTVAMIDETPRGETADSETSPNKPPPQAAPFGWPSSSKAKVFSVVGEKWKFI